MLQKCTLKGSYSILSKTAVLEEENMKLLFITHECCISQNSENTAIYGTLLAISKFLQNNCAFS